MNSTTIQYGTLIRYLETSNYGYIREDMTGTDYFVHVSSFVEKIAPPQNTRLKFHLASNPKKPGRIMAVGVEVIRPKAIVVQYGDGGAL
jgi:cold shock CspA family protein